MWLFFALINTMGMYFLLGDNASESFPKGCYLWPSVKDETEVVPAFKIPAVDGDNSVV